MNQLGVFAKFWQPGTVKTRLAKTIGIDAACKIYRCFLFHLLEQLAASGDRRDVVFSPQERESKFRKSIPTAWNLCPQAEGNLGQRMANYFRSQFENSPNEQLGLNKEATKIVVIGADCPLVNPKIVDSAFKMLDQVPVVIGPSDDGGYYLLAMRDRCFDIFFDVQWSTPKVFDQTIEHLRKTQTEYGVLDPMNDIDEFQDLLQLANQLKRSFQSQNSHAALLAQAELALAQVDSTRESQ